MSQLKVNALVSYSGNTVTLGTSGDTINVASGVTFNTASATVTLPTTIKVSTIQNTNSTNLITQTNVTTITFGATSQTISVPSVASFASTIGVGGATPAASGAGVSFPASASASSDANTLDDYEEGTYTITTNANLTANSGYATFQYTKIGRQVTVNGGLVVSAVSSTNVVLISLPFTSKGNPASGQSVNAGSVCPLGGVTTGDAGLVVQIPSSSTDMTFRKINNNGATASLTNADLAVNDELLITVTYFI
jgi:hypothetical protein